MRMWPWPAVYLWALLSRLVRICASRSRSAQTSGRSGGRSIVSVCCLRASSGRMESAIGWTISAKSSGCALILTCPASIRDVSRISLVIATSRSALDCTISRYSRTSGSIGPASPSRSRSVKPLIEVSGVRSSCETSRHELGFHLVGLALARGVAEDEQPPQAGAGAGAHRHAIPDKRVIFGAVDDYLAGCLVLWAVEERVEHIEHFVWLIERRV